MTVFITDENLIEKFEKVEGPRFQDQDLIKAFQAACKKANLQGPGDYLMVYDILNETHSRAVIYGAGGSNRYVVDTKTGEVTYEETHGSPTGLKKAQAEGFRGTQEKKAAALPSGVAPSGSGINTNRGE